VKGQTSENRAFWNGLSEQKFLLQYDKRSARYQFYPKPWGPSVLGLALEWRAASGTGVIVAFTEDRTRRATPPVLLVLVRLDEGPRVFAPIVNCRFGELRAGARVKFYWSDAQAFPYQFELESLEEGGRLE
jgi:uncharacterized protein